MADEGNEAKPLTAAGRGTGRRRKTPAARTIPEDIRNLPTKAARIRALAALGWSRSEIARAMGVRYQQVYNALSSGGAKAAKRAAAESPAHTSGPARRSAGTGEAAAPEATPGERAATPGPASRETAGTEVPWHRLWRLLALIVFGVVIGVVVGLLWIAAVVQVGFLLVRRGPSRTVAGLERRLDAYLAQIVHYFRNTGESEVLPFPFSDLPRKDSHH